MHPIIHDGLNKARIAEFPAGPSGTGSPGPLSRPTARAGNTAMTRRAAARAGSSPAAC